MFLLLSVTIFIFYISFLYLSFYFILFQFGIAGERQRAAIGCALLLAGTVSGDDAGHGDLRSDEVISVKTVFICELKLITYKICVLPTFFVSKLLFFVLCFLFSFNF